MSLQSDSGTLFPCPSLPPEHPWAPGTSLGPQEALGTFGSLQQPWVFSQTQGARRSEGARAFLDPWNFPGASGSLGSLWKPSTALGFQSDSWTSFPWLLFAPCSPSPLILPVPLGPWEALGAFGNNQLPWGLQSDTGALFSLLPLTPPPPFSLHIQHCVYSTTYTALHIQHHLYGAAYMAPLIQHHVYSTGGAKGSERATW